MSLKSCEKTGTNEVTLEITIDADAFAAACVKAYNNTKKSITVPGFRKGKASKALIEKYYGESVFYEDALELAFPAAYDSAVKESGIEDVDEPFDFDVKSLGKDGVELSCKVTVKPEIEIGEYKGLKAEKETVTVTAEDIDKELKNRQEQNARIIDVDDRAVENGDIAVIDYEGFNDGVPFEGGKAESYDLEIGSGQFIPGFEEQIIGHSIDEEFDINVTFPEDYGAEDLAGKEVVFKIKINGIKVKELPEIDDEFAKDISEFDTLDELKADIEKSITEERQKKADNDFESALLDMVTESVQGEIPQCMIEKAIDDMIHDMDYRLQMQGLDFATYMQYMGMDEAYVRETYKEQAEKNVKLMLAIEKIAALENVEATEEELNAHYAKYAEAYSMDIEEIKKIIPDETAENDVVSQKTIDLIVNSAKAVKPKKTTAKKTASKKAKAAETNAEATDDKGSADDNVSETQDKSEQASQNEESAE
ncbi:MAG: trigger factor [Clostridiales bacterium]|nr:trigger factor [Clostridiales bacterium]